MTTVERYDEVLPGVDYTQTPLPVAAEIAELNLQFIRNELSELHFCKDPGQYQSLLKAKAEWFDNWIITELRQLQSDFGLDLQEARSVINSRYALPFQFEIYCRAANILLDMRDRTSIGLGHSQPSPPDITPEIKDLLDYPGAAEYVKSSVSKLQKEVSLKKITHKKVGERVYFKHQWLDEWVARNSAIIETSSTTY
jgi:hypothetical protein